MTLELAILLALDAVSPLTLCETTLHAEMGLRLPERPTLTGLRQTLEGLERKRQAVGLDTEDRGRVWRITDNGRARVANAE